MRKICLRAILLAAGGIAPLTACAPQATSMKDIDSGSVPAQSATPSTNDLFARLPDQATAKCLGRLEFADAFRATGQSTCGNRFIGTADEALADGMVCVYSATPGARTTTEYTAAGYFACSDSSTGKVRFLEKTGSSQGVATVTSDDGSIITFTYLNRP